MKASFTPVPNLFFDKQMGLISASALRVYLKICRNTMGWRDQYGNTKQMDWISHSQFGDIGVSSRSVTTAVEELLEQGMIHVSDGRGNPLHDPKLRKRAKRIYYGLTAQTQANTTSYKAKNDQNNAESHMGPLQKLRSTKEIPQNFSGTQKNTGYHRIPDHERLRQILQGEERKQSKRDGWL